jgi:hypothetical protein
MKNQSINYIKAHGVIYLLIREKSRFLCGFPSTWARISCFSRTTCFSPTKGHCTLGATSSPTINRKESFQHFNISRCSNARILASYGGNKQAVTGQLSLHWGSALEPWLQLALSRMTNVPGLLAAYILVMVFKWRHFEHDEIDYLQHISLWKILLTRILVNVEIEVIIITK